MGDLATKVYAKLKAAKNRSTPKTCGRNKRIFHSLRGGLSPNLFLSIPIKLAEEEVVVVKILTAVDVFAADIGDLILGVGFLYKVMEG